MVWRSGRLHEQARVSNGVLNCAKHVSRATMTKLSTAHACMTCKAEALSISSNARQGHWSTAQHRYPGYSQLGRGIMQA